MKRWKIFPMKIAFPSCFSFRFYLQAASFINTMHRIFFITVFLNMFNDPLKYWCFYISLDVFLMVDTFISGLWWSWGRYCSSTLLYNAHPLMLIDDVQRKLKDLCQQIHNSLRKQKISDCFLPPAIYLQQLW